MGKAVVWRSSSVVGLNVGKSSAAVAFDGDAVVDGATEVEGAGVAVGAGDTVVARTLGPFVWEGAELPLGLPVLDGAPVFDGERV